MVRVFVVTIQSASAGSGALKYADLMFMVAMNSANGGKSANVRDMMVGL